MPVLSRASYLNLYTCHPDLTRVAVYAIKDIDFAVLEGHRGEIAQHAAFLRGDSQKDWPNSKHNKNPSDAVHFRPWPIDWRESSTNLQRSCLLAGIILATGWHLGIELRWGGDWNSDGDTRDEHFRDYDHFERKT